MKRTALLLCAVCAGCAGPAMYTKAVLYDETARHAASPRCEILDAEPERPYVVLALLETRMGPEATFPEYLENMRAKARELGADAIIEIESETITTPKQVTTEPWFGGFYSYGGERVLIVRAKAIRYE